MWYRGGVHDKSCLYRTSQLDPIKPFGPGFTRRLISSGASPLCHCCDITTFQLPPNENLADHRTLRTHHECKSSRAMKSKTMVLFEHSHRYHELLPERKQISFVCFGGVLSQLKTSQNSWITCFLLSPWVCCSQSVKNIQNSLITKRQPFNNRYLLFLRLYCLVCISMCVDVLWSVDLVGVTCWDAVLMVLALMSVRWCVNALRMFI